LEGSKAAYPTGVGRFPASITSPEAFEALRNLHKTDPALFNELSNDSGQPTSVLDADDEAPFPETPDDTSDIPLEVIQQHLAQRMLIQRLKIWRRLKCLGL